MLLFSAVTLFSCQEQQPTQPKKEIIYLRDVGMWTYKGSHQHTLSIEAKRIEDSILVAKFVELKGDTPLKEFLSSAKIQKNQE